MNTELTFTNESFNFLKGSSEFLNLILNHISSCVLLLDRNLKLHAFNDALTTIFSRNRNEDLHLTRCGEAIGCAYTVEEQKDCGTTSKCQFCELRESALISYMNDEVVISKRVKRPFFDYENNKIEKHLDFSTRLFEFKNEKYIIMLIEDNSMVVELEEKYKTLLKENLRK